MEKKKEVSSDAIRHLMEERSNRQKTIIEAATRKGGRGRRARKKTVSDMSGMLASIPPTDLPTPSKQSSSPAVITKTSDLPEHELQLHDMTKPEPTVVGVFRKTVDPFQVMGQSLNALLGRDYPKAANMAGALRKGSLDITKTDSSDVDLSRSSIKVSVSDGELNGMTPIVGTP